MENNRQIWLEKYRPQSLDEVKGQETIIESLQQYVQSGNLPNLLFSGPPGVGKTATAVGLARDLYGSDWEQHFLELNASDERGIDVVREDIKQFARTETPNEQFRIIFLDESDALTSDAQAALRRTMEQFSGNVRFILSCNYLSQIISPLQSRCTPYRFSGLSDSAVTEQVEEIAESENISLSEDAVDALVYVSNGDMRRAINGLRAVDALDGSIDADRVYDLTNTLRPEQIEAILEYAMDGEFIKSRKETQKAMNEVGVSATELVDQIYRFIWDSSSITGEEATEITDLLSDIDYRVSQGANPEIQVDGFLSKVSMIDTTINK